MPRPQSGYEEMAREAAQAIDKARALGEQLSLLPDEAAEAGDGAGKRGKGKVQSQLREWLVARGYRAPEEMLAQIAGLDGGDDPVLTAMVKAERIMAWMYDRDLPEKDSPRPSSRVARDVFRLVYAAQVRALDALMPYMAPKATPDVAVNQQVNVIVPVAPSVPGDPAAAARVVSPRPGGRMAPPPMPWEIEQEQAVSCSPADGADGGRRTE